MSFAGERVDVRMFFSLLSIVKLVGKKTNR